MVSHSKAGPWLVAGAAFFWGTSATLARYAFRDLHVPPLTAVELRLALAAGILGLFLAFRSPRFPSIERRDWPALMIVALPGLAAVQGTYYYSISILGVGLAILLQYLAPCLLVLRDLLRGRHVERTTLLAIMLALAGTALLLGNLDPTSVSATPLQWGTGFLSAFAFAFYIVSSKRLLRRYPPVTTLFYTFCIAGVFWAVVTPPWKIMAADYDVRYWLLFLTLAVFSTLVPFALFNAGLHRLRATQAGVFSTLEPVVAVLSASVFLGESLRPLQILGALLVLIASALASRQSTS